MNYVVDYAPVGNSTILAWDGDESPQEVNLESGKSTAKSNVFNISHKKARKALPSSVDTVTFLTRLGEDDTVFTALGGQNDRFCMAVSRTKAKLLRLPTSFISDEQKAQRKEGKVGDQVENASSIMYRMALSMPEIFYPFRPVDDLRYLEVRLLSRMYWTVQRKIRIATANRLRHLQQDLELIGGLKNLPVIRGAIDNVLETLPAKEEVELDFDDKKGVAVKFYKSIERRLSQALEAKLNELPMYNAVFKPVEPKLIGIAGYVISQILDIRRFPTLGKLRAFAGYHLVLKEGVWKAPKPERGSRANWDHTLQQAVYYFTAVVDKQKPSNPWKAQLQTRYRYEVVKLLDRGRNEDKIPEDMTTEKFLVMVAELRAEAKENDTIAKLPEPYKGIPVLARKRAMRWLGQQFLKYIWTEWRRFEGISDEGDQNIAISA